MKKILMILIVTVMAGNVFAATAGGSGGGDDPDKGRDDKRRVCNPQPLIKRSNAVVPENPDPATQETVLLGGSQATESESPAMEETGTAETVED